MPYIHNKLSVDQLNHLYVFIQFNIAVIPWCPFEGKANKPLCDLHIIYLVRIPAKHSKFQEKKSKV
jgi:hypothetical protein